MIANTAEERLRILNYWEKYGIKAACDASRTKRSALYGWQKHIPADISLQ